MPTDRRGKPPERGKQEKLMPLQGFHDRLKFDSRLVDDHRNTQIIVLIRGSRWHGQDDLGITEQAEGFSLGRLVFLRPITGDFKKNLSPVFVGEGEVRNK